MDAKQADALVFFGATGDLAFKKIYPARKEMMRHGHLNVPVIGVARSGWDLERSSPSGASWATPPGPCTTWRSRRACSLARTASRPGPCA